MNIVNTAIIYNVTRDLDNKMIFKGFIASFYYNNIVIIIILHVK